MEDTDPVGGGGSGGFDSGVSVGGDTGIGAGGGGNGVGSETFLGISVAPKAKTIFRNSNMTDENWEVVEKMLEKIVKDCMGQNLYNGLVEKLDGKTCWMFVL